MKLTLDEHLSPHFTVGEFFRSGTAIRLGIDNNPDAHPGEGISTAEVMENLRALCTEVLEPLRRRVGRVIVTSGYRCQELNKAVGGVWNSQHLKGEAADIFVPDTATAMRYGHILERHSAVQQLLLEPMGIQQKRWIHVGFRRSE
ncbi:D-Ala-D-Ala carboxypeptidase family metallohydrolase [Prevotella nigrescens]|jgi:peptidase M15|uniref:D-Ala-D-Ala carboxypeptidase family metallohydrolase n=1 Tax=Prevotella nigrescens TaxID=28133 RepID=UPI0002182F49|nr:D-Ala-D-Ala carboxypeptidase family metallohydrolase [Prevotella nigrescens]EGQ12162.1 peptidase M15 superfamily protein [Prevotella nigrescens ATCC 33563]UAK29599.1 peptidase M15 [Prevotella nigrescens]WMS21100.1 D-Ala-D-Ala carboxypeptidase family metallohydrolase [Prevotella nigrescens]SUB97004.1 Peptidase M15 [Prevotella nigrescens]